MDDCNNELMEAAEDEDGINQMNDLTFGDEVYVEDEDEDWESHHEKLTSASGGGSLGGRRSDGGVLRFGMNEDCLYDIDDDGEPYPLEEADLEHNLNQLVVDEEDEEEPGGDVEGIGNGGIKIYHHQSIPKKSINLEELFGPASPPGLFHAEELVSGEANIWGSPMRQSYLLTEDNAAIQNLFRSLNGSGVSDVSATQFHVPQTIVSGRGRALTLEELEQELGGSQNRGPPSVPAPRRALTLEELEQELLRSPPPQPAERRGGGLVGPVVTGSVLTVEEVERRLKGDLQVGSSNQSQNRDTHQSGNTQMGRASNPPSLPSGALPLNTSELPDLLRHPGILPFPPPTADDLVRLKMAQSLGQPPPRVMYPSMPLPAHGLPLRPPAGYGIFPFNTMMPPPMHSGQRAPLFFDPAATRGGRYPVPVSQPNMLQHRHLHPGAPPAGFNDPAFVHAMNYQHLLQQQNSHHRHHHPGLHQLTPQQALFLNLQQQHRGPVNMPGGPMRPPAPMALPNNYPLLSQQRFQQLQMLRHLAAQGIRIPQGGPGMGYHHDNQRGDGGGDDEDEDEYAGLMLQREKDWVVKIQLLQLHTDNPYVDDYYFTCWSMKKMLQEKQLREGIQRQNKSSGSEPTLVLPQLAKVDTKIYAPVQFEGSLGRLTASSIHNPRQMIDLHGAGLPDVDEVKRWEHRRFRQTMLNIEKGYISLLDIDDMEKKALAQPLENRAAICDERRRLVSYLYDSLHCTEQSTAPSTPLVKDFSSLSTTSFSQILSVRKGVMFIARLLPLFEKVEAETVVCALLHKLPQITRKDWQDEVWPRVYESMNVVIQSSDLAALVLFSTQLSQDSLTTSNITTGNPAPDKNIVNTIISMLQNKLGVSLITCLLSRGEVVYETHSPLDMDTQHQQQWRSFVENVATSLSNMEKDQFVHPAENFANIVAHFNRMLDKRSLLSVEDKLLHLLPLPSLPVPQSASLPSLTPTPTMRSLAPSTTVVTASQQQ